MRIERWYWLLAFCFVSLCVHVGTGWMSRNYHGSSFALAQPHTIEVALEPLPEPIKPEPKVEPKQPDPKPAAKPIPKADPGPKPVVHVRREPKRIEPRATTVAKVDKPVIQNPDA